MATKFFILLLVQTTYTQAVADDCIVTYSQQPPAELPCNPYATHLSPPEIFVGFACRADSTVPLEDFQITWFHESSDGMVENLGCPLPHIDTDTLQRCRLDISGESNPGSYWCVASYTENGNVQTLPRSNVVQIERATAYANLPRCDGTILETVSNCPGTTVTSIEASVTTLSSKSSTQVVMNLQTKSSSPLRVSSISDISSTSGANLPTQQTTTTTAAAGAPLSTTSASDTFRSVTQYTANTATHTIPTVTSSSSATEETSTISSTAPPETTNSMLTRSDGNNTIVITLIITCAVLLVGLVITIFIMAMIVIVYRRKIRRIRTSEAHKGIKVNSRHPDLEGSTSTQMNEKYVYPLTTGIYSVPSREETIKSGQSDDSGRGSEESYQSLLCTNMEYTSIYTTTLNKSNSIVKSQTLAEV